MKKKVYRKILINSIICFCIVIGIFIFYTYVGERMIVNGNSMEPTLSDSQQIIIDKISYQFQAPSRYDIVVIEIKDGMQYKYLKRIVGLPGEEIFYNEDGYVTVNGILLSSELRFEQSDLESWANIVEPIILGEDEYFVLGDNRNDSIDSRSLVLGTISTSEILGKAIFCIFPLDELKLLK